MTYDCFSFFNEVDLLEIRLNTLDKVVDKFILAESTLTHTGVPKPLYYAENKERFAKFNGRIIHIVVNDFPPFPNTSATEMAWIRENWQRNALIRGLPKEATDDDYVIISDLDEIPSPDAVIRAKAHKGVTRLYLTMFYYFLNYKNYTYPIWCLGPQVLPLKILCDNTATFDANYSTFIDPRVNKGITPTVVRFMTPEHIITNAGWHFSYCGGIVSVQSKIRSIAHTENNSIQSTDYDEIKKRIFAGKPPFQRDDSFFAVPISQRFPPYIQGNKAKFSSLIFPVTPLYCIKTFLPRFFVSGKRILIETLRLILPRCVRDWLYFHFIDTKKLNARSKSN